MLKRFKYIFSVLTIFICTSCVLAQNKGEYKDVMLDGKPAKLNVLTGEVTLINAKVETADLSSKLDEENKVKIEIDEIDPTDFHIVKEGEGLLDLSRKYNVSLTDLKKYNDLETTLINQGQKLRVKNFHRKPKTEPKIVVNDTVISENKPQTKVDQFHIVKKDETLYSLSRQYNLSLNELKRLNNLNSNLINVGQKLQIVSLKVDPEIGNASVWEVSKGDTLYSIAKKNGTTVDALKRLNGLTSNLIKVGQKLELK